MMSVSSPTPAYRTPARVIAREAPMTPGDRLLQKIEKEDERDMLRQLYPEMFDSNQKPRQKPKEVKKALVMFIFEI